MVNPVQISQRRPANLARWEPGNLLERHEGLSEAAYDLPRCRSLIMTNMTQERMRADWTATKDITGFQELLKDETEDGRYNILSQLLSDEFAKFKTEAEVPKPFRTDSKRAIVNLGNPLVGLLLGALIVVGTMGGFFLWDNLQGSVDARTAISMGPT
jgi:hypothetical protein